MSFWTTSDGEDVSDTGTDFDAGGGSMEPMPEGTKVLAAMDEAKWDDMDGAEYLSFRWTVLKPEGYQNRKIFQKVWAKDHNPKQNDHDKAEKQTNKAKRMFAAIDANAGGKLVAAKREPSNDDLQQHLMNKPMVLKLGVWAMKKDDGSDMSGNWVMAVSDKGSELATPAAKPKPQVAGGGSSDEDMDIPF